MDLAAAPLRRDKAGINGAKVIIQQLDPRHASPFAAHGGALEAARRRYRDAPAPWIDLSTGINPHAYSIGAMPAEVWSRLPEAEPLAAMEAAAAARYGCPAQAEVVAAPGTQAIIQHLPDLLSGRDVRVLGPTYSEFARVFAARADVQDVATLAGLKGADIAVLVNPNNPDGRLLATDTILALAAEVGALVVDEAFMDALDPALTLVPRLGAARLMVLRSFGKFYGLAGLRLGFAVAPPSLARSLRHRLGPWAVSGPALAIGACALADGEWQAATRRRLAAEAARLDAILTGAGLDLVGGTPLFRLARHGAAGALFGHLAQAGILVRPYADAPTWLRFGLPGKPDAWRRLQVSLDGFAL